jgi:hypothetical protein
MRINKKSQIYKGAHNHGLLSQHEKSVLFKDIIEGSYADQYEETLFWLLDSMISNECFLCNDPNVGLSINEKRTYVKCIILLS